MERWTITARGKRLDPRGRWVLHDDHRAEFERWLGVLESFDPELAELVRGELGEIANVAEEQPKIMHAIGGPDLAAEQRAHRQFVADAKDAAKDYRKPSRQPRPGDVPRKR